MGMNLSAVDKATVNNLEMRPFSSAKVCAHEICLDMSDPAQGCRYRSDRQTRVWSTREAWADFDKLMNPIKTDAP